ncbi:hypothetical protein M2139_001492 [Enterococcus sp. PF1-24]|uniref:hypothetical protein n=1 Tax=unclassified Enterococcus TaxID=2608891 RepID=UPI0024766399|nr:MULTISPECIES: hypothetical protein [unclassified Enterococcus]MDH6364517.1 hypothetical protein [Enterococcus sp. PFB1-1]MDH6401606.1 hypothetical protein [Enterococcus sp. PF1-24]
MVIRKKQYVIEPTEDYVKKYKKKDRLSIILIGCILEILFFATSWIFSLPDFKDQDLYLKCLYIAIKVLFLGGGILLITEGVKYKKHDTPWFIDQIKISYTTKKKREEWLNKVKRDKKFPKIQGFNAAYLLTKGFPLLPSLIMNILGFAIARWLLVEFFIKATLVNAGKAEDIVQTIVYLLIFYYAMSLIYFVFKQNYKRVCNQILNLITIITVEVNKMMYEEKLVKLLIWLGFTFGISLLLKLVWEKYNKKIWKTILGELAEVEHISAVPGLEGKSKEISLDEIYPFLFPATVWKDYVTLTGVEIIEKQRRPDGKIAFGKFHSDEKGSYYISDEIYFPKYLKIEYQLKYSLLTKELVIQMNNFDGNGEEVIYVDEEENATIA